MTTWMDPEGFVQSEMSGRERQILYDLTYMRNQKHQTHRYGEQTGGCQRQVLEGGGMSEGSPKVEDSGYKIRKSWVTMSSTMSGVNIASCNC